MLSHVFKLHAVVPIGPCLQQAFAHHIRRNYCEYFMKPDKRTIILPILLIVIGSGWLLTTLGVGPGIDWIWTLGLAVTGMLMFAVGGFDKATFVAGSFFIVASCLSLLRQTERVTIDVEVPILVIVSGILMLVARHPKIPVPKWIKDAGRVGDDAASND